MTEDTLIRANMLDAELKRKLARFNLYKEATMPITIKQEDDLYEQVRQLILGSLNKEIIDLDMELRKM